MFYFAVFFWNYFLWRCKVIESDQKTLFKNFLHRLKSNHYHISKKKIVANALQTSFQYLHPIRGRWLLSALLIVSLWFHRPMSLRQTYLHGDFSRGRSLIRRIEVWKKFLVSMFFLWFLFKWEDFFNYF